MIPIGMESTVTEPWLGVSLASAFLDPDNLVLPAYRLGCNEAFVFFLADCMFLCGR